MAKPDKPGIGETLNNWVQAVGIIIAAIWAVYTFVYKEITVPKSAPVNLTLNLNVQKLKTNPNKNLVPIELVATVNNPSPRLVYLLPNVWLAKGRAIVPRNIEVAPTGKEKVSDKNRIAQTQKHSRPGPATIVGFGGLFPDEFLAPNETITRKLVLYVPPDTYDSLEIEVAIPTVSKRGGYTVEWSFDQPGKGESADNRQHAEGVWHLHPTTKSIRVGKEHTVKRKNDGRIYGAEEYDLQTTRSKTTLSLWQ